MAQCLFAAVAQIGSQGARGTLAGLPRLGAEGCGLRVGAAPLLQDVWGRGLVVLGHAGVEREWANRGAQAVRSGGPIPPHMAPSFGDLAEGSLKRKYPPNTVFLYSHFARMDRLQQQDNGETMP